MWRITGRVVVQETGRPIAGLIVKAIDLDLIWHDFLGETRTDENGEFEITYTEKDFSDGGLESAPDIVLHVRIPGNDREIINTRTFPRNNAKMHEHYDLTVSFWAFRREDGMRFWSHRPQVRGRVITGETENPIESLHAELWDADRGQRVAMDPTDHDGVFALWYDDSEVLGPRKFVVKLRMPSGGREVFVTEPLAYNGVETVSCPIRLSYTVFSAADGPLFAALQPEAAPADVAIDLPRWED
jgi:hypothetical protein